VTKCLAQQNTLLSPTCQSTLCCQRYEAPCCAGKLKSMDAVATWGALLCLIVHLNQAQRVTFHVAYFASLCVVGLSHTHAHKWSVWAAGEPVSE
jgi:hypothetical protein